MILRRSSDEVFVLADEFDVEHKKSVKLKAQKSKPQLKTQNLDRNASGVGAYILEIDSFDIFESVLNFEL